MMYRMFVIAIISSFISITSYSQNIPSHRNHEFEAHGKSAYNTAVALSKRALYTIPEAENYDVKHYDINVRIVINVMTFSGSTAMTIESLTDGLDTVKYDFHERGVVDSVFVNGVLTPHAHIGDVIAVGLDAPLGTGGSATIRTVYRYMFPSDALIVKGVTNENLGKSTYSIASHVEPYDARKWWPCKDDPADKADSVDITITTNSYLEVVSNGELVSDTPLDGGLHATHWKTRYPIATYLFSIALSEYSKNEYTWNYQNFSMPVTTWFFRENDEDVQRADNAVLEGLTVFSELFGIYPFYEEKYGMAEYVWGGAMEHQTITSMGAFYADIAIHELAHQWFGDKVTCATFEHIWLNEGWATYCESLYYEMKYGVQARNSNLSYNKYFGPGTIFVDDPENKDKSEIFSGDLTYNKSSWVVHMLRGVVGDSAFFRATRNYLGDLRKENYRSVTTAEFQEYYEIESGMDLDFFFDEWIYGEYYPAYSFGFDTTPEQDKYRTTVSIEQMNVPEHQIFTMPIQLLFRFAQFDSTVTIWNDTQAATYQFVFDAAPVSVTLDPNNWILKQVEIPEKPLVNPDFKNTVLLVNGIEWSDGYYGDLLRDSFANGSYTADYPYVFYDLYPFPSGGYPETLPPPAGSAAIPLEELEKFCTVVWLGGADATDVVKTGETPLLEYVERGGNLIMMPMMAGYYLQPDIQTYLGVGWYGSPISYFAECDAAQPYLVDMTPTITQYPVSVMNMASSSPYNEVLFTDDITYGEQVALGIWNKPHSTEFGTSGNFILLSMMGYGMDQAGLRYNMDVLLDSIMCNRTVGVVRPQSPVLIQLQQNYPNPSHNATTFTYTVGPENGLQPVTLKIYDYLGRVVSQPLTAARTPGTYTIRVNTEVLPKGTYRVRLCSANASVWQTMTVVH